ncbi:MAG: LysM peptidoglycan-binding domain-containing protein [Muribaculaceae bacterium]|nr:LysM peptidoglycan-binding domain-containing protein [Muribaculaceae bacterium]
MKIRTILVPLALLLGTAVAAARPLSILQIRDSLHNVPVVYPESFETDVHKMQQNWYLQNYADIDRNADSRASVTPTDEELIERLRSMPTIIEMPFNSVVRNSILMYTDRRKQLVENMLGMSLYYMPIFEQALDRYGLPLELKYLPIIESALNPEAVSRAGATGLWQFMLPTATGEGLEVSSLVDQRRDPYTSSDAAARYLKKLYDIFGDWSLAIASYNCGPGNVNKAIRRAGEGKKDFWQIYPYLPTETRGYVPAFIAANYVMNYYDKHNISPALAKKPIVTDTVHITRRVHFEQISDVLGIPLDEIKTLNPQYRTGLIPGDIRPYALVLPSLQVYAYLAHEDSIVNHNASRYGRRDVVEPAVTGSGSDSKGDYVEELVVRYHTVKKGQTLASIARQYGVTQASIRKANKIGKKVTRGQKLRINTYQKRYLVKTQDVAQTVQPVKTDTVVTDTAGISMPAVSDTSAVADIAQASNENSRVVQAMAVSQDVSKRPAAVEKKKPAASGQSKPQAQIHTVRKGENLSKIASRYGVTVNAIRVANNLKNDGLQIGQKLKIPAKSDAKSSKRRRKK